jgi:hypothetical protein
MNEQIKKRIEQILRGEVPEGYKHEKGWYHTSRMESHFSR